MNLIYAEIVDVVVHEGFRMGRVRVGGAVKKVPLVLLTNPAAGDIVPLCDSFEISPVKAMTNPEERSPKQWLSTNVETG